MRITRRNLKILIENYLNLNEDDSDPSKFKKGKKLEITFEDISGRPAKDNAKAFKLLDSEKWWKALGFDNKKEDCYVYQAKGGAEMKLGPVRYSKGDPYTYEEAGKDKDGNQQYRVMSGPSVSKHGTKPIGKVFTPKTPPKIPTPTPGDSENDGEFVHQPGKQPSRPKGQKWQDYYSRKDVQTWLVEEFERIYGVKIKTDPRMPFVKFGGRVYSKFGEQHSDTSQDTNDYDPVVGSEKVGHPFMGVIKSELVQIQIDGKFEHLGSIAIGFSGRVATGGVGTSSSTGLGDSTQKIADKITKAGGDGEKFIKDFKEASGRK